MLVLLMLVLLPPLPGIASGAADCGTAGAADGAIGRALGLTPPQADDVTDAEFEDADFWDQNELLLKEAWAQLGLDNSSLSTFRDEFIDARLRKAVLAARANPSADTEAAVKALWTEVVPGVYSCRIFTEAFVVALRRELERCKASGIPTRRPNGMNRYGVIIGDVAGGTPGLHGLFKGLVDRYIRRLALALFPGAAKGDDTCDYFAFTINYEPGKDVALREHRDASTVTLNVNLNSASQHYTGSGVEFVDEKDSTVRRTVQFRPGVAILHKGGHRHAALPLESGQRTNLVLWLFGEDGYVRAAQYPPSQQHGPALRWGSQPQSTPDCGAGPGVLAGASSRTGAGPFS